MTDVSRSEFAIQKHSKSFSLAARLLPADARQPALILYAWCRKADDAIDEDTSGHPEQRVAELRAELDAIYGGRELSDPVARAFQDVVHRYSIPRRYPEELLLGMQMDAEGTEYAELEELLLYCYRVAATVGLMMCHVLGVRHGNALRHAAHLGIAMQLTNICRDVREDYSRGRLYLPEALLRASDAAALRPPEGGGPAAQLPPTLGPALAKTVERLLELAGAYYRSAERGLPYLPLRSRIAVAASQLIYAAIGGVLRRRSCDIFGPRAYVSRLDKWRFVLQATVWAWWLGLRSPSSPSSQSAAGPDEPLPCFHYGSDLLLR